MKIFMFLLLLVTACCSPVNHEEAISYKVALELVVHEEHSLKYPTVTKALNSAVQEWEQHIPIAPTILTEPKKDSSTFLSIFGLPSFLNRPGIIQVLIDDLQGPGYDLPQNIIGLWQPQHNPPRLLFDGDYLESSPDIAYSTALHELGHVFGVPHIVNKLDGTISGFVVLEDSAEEFVMYPANVPGKGQNKLSEIEINIARHYVLFELTRPRKSSDCSLTSQN